MRTAKRPLALLGGLAAAILLAARQVYRDRSTERVPGGEGLDDPQVAEAFTRIAAIPQMRVLRWMVARRAVALAPAGRAMDLGSGPGYLVAKLAQVSPDLMVTGLDLSDELLAESRRYAERCGAGERTAFVKGDLARIPLAAGSLDLAVSTLSLHHWSDPVGALDEIARVVRPGGSFVLFDLRRDIGAPCYLLLWFVTHVAVPRALRRVREPLSSRDASYTPQEVERLAEQSNLTGWRVTRGPLWLTIEGTRTRR